MNAPKRLEQMEHLQTHGYAIIPDFLDSQQLTTVNQLYDTLLGEHQGRNNFEGSRTERIYTLVARDKLFQDIAEDVRIMALCDELFLPNYLLTASQAIVISPGETPQPWHSDDTFYTIPRPRPMVSLSTIVAVEDFTAKNGGTEIIPGSHLWDDQQVEDFYRRNEQQDDSASSSDLQAMPVEMAAGSCLVFAGTLMHRGGANKSTATRRAFSNQYCQPWARPQENFFLAIPPAEVAKMSAKIQSLLGYSIHPPFMGQLTASHPLKALQPNFVPPAFRARKKL